MTKEAKTYSGKKTVSSISGAQKTGQTHIKELEYSLTPYRKTNLKWIKDLYVRPDTINFLEENISRTLSDIKSRDIFFCPPPRVMKIKKANKWCLIKLISLCPAKETINKMKR